MKGGRQVGSGTVQVCDECLQPSTGELYHVRKQWRCRSCMVKLYREKERQASTLLASTSKVRKELEDLIRHEKKARSARERRRREHEDHAAEAEEDHRVADERHAAAEHAREVAEQVRAGSGDHGPYRGPADATEAGCPECGRYDGRHGPGCKVVAEILKVTSALQSNRQDDVLEVLGAEFPREIVVRTLRRLARESPA